MMGDLAPAVGALDTLPQPPQPRGGRQRWDGIGERCVEQHGDARSFEAWANPRDTTNDNHRNGTAKTTVIASAAAVDEQRDHDGERDGAEREGERRTLASARQSRPGCRHGADNVPMMPVR